MNLQEVSIESIKPYWRNPRQSEAAIPAVRASIERYGYRVPIVVDQDLVIIAGHARYAALNQLGHNRVWVVVADLSPQKARMLRIADNKSHEWSTWDPDRLQAELKELSDLSAVRAHFRGPEWDEIFGQDLAPPEPIQSLGQAAEAHKAGQKPICPYCGTIQ